MIAAARGAGVLFSVFQNRRWDSDYLTVRRVLDEGLLGEPYVIESAVTSFGPSPGYRNPTSDRPRGWRTYAEFGGGPMRDWGAHLFDQAVQLAGPRPETIFADFQYRRDWDVETAGMAYLRYPGGDGREGLRFTIETGAISAVPKPRWLIRGSEGAYVQSGRDAQEAALHRGEVGPRVMDPENAPRVVRYEDGQLRDVPVEQVPGNYLAYYLNVAAALRGRAPLAVRPEDVLDSIRLLVAAVESAQSKQSVEVRG
jgi:scyllo-inositol 2-dehydrogenase (NADP+)